MQLICCVGCSLGLCVCRDVKIYRLISKNSIEEAMLRCGEKKLKLEMDVTGGGQKGRTLLFNYCFCYTDQHIYVISLV